MLRGLAFVPGSPLLVPGLGGSADVLATLRATCLAAIGDLGPGPLVVIGPGSCSSWHDAGTARFGGWGPGGVVTFAGPGTPQPPAAALEPRLPAVAAAGGWLPAGVAVGVWLATQVGTVVASAVVADEAVDLPVPAGAGLVVVGDGSACRGPRAPLPDDPRGEVFDRDLLAALADGEPAALAALLAREPAATDLAVSGRHPWRAAAQAAAGRLWHAQVLAAQAPLGVAYTVVTWR